MIAVRGQHTVLQRATRAYATGLPRVSQTLASFGPQQMVLRG